MHLLYDTKLLTWASGNPEGKYTKHGTLSVVLPWSHSETTLLYQYVFQENKKH